MEDQVRRMILEGGSGMPRPENATSDARPVVRLPSVPLVSGSGHSGRSDFLPPHLRHGKTNHQALGRSEVMSDGGSDLVPPHLKQGGNNIPPLRQNMADARTHDLPPHLKHERPSAILPADRSSKLYQQGPCPSQESRSLPRHTRPAQRQGQRMQLPLDPNAFNRDAPAQRGGNCGQQRQPQQQLYDPTTRPSRQTNTYVHQHTRPFSEQHMRQAEHLNEIATAEISMAEMTKTEQDEKERFRVGLQDIISKLCEANPERLPRISLQCFGSFQSGFASRGSDMDLAIVSKDPTRDSACFSLMDRDLPRTLEKKLLELGYGARLLTRTRVPIIKICEKPPVDLLTNLREERDKWDALTDEKKYPHLYGDEDADAVAGTVRSDATTQDACSNEAVAGNAESVTPAKISLLDKDLVEGQAAPSTDAKTTEVQTPKSQAPRQRRDQTWTRERRSGPLDFPKDGIGIQSDINFFNPLGLHNTQMLRNYSLCDPRVRPIVLFIKAWAKRRKINSAYSGTLSSYGYVLMVLHYLVNVAQPAVLPNLQSPWRPNAQCTPPGATRTAVDNWVVDFWQSEAEITTALQQGQMSRNTESIGSLLVGFFSYFSSTGSGPQFHWMKDVLALRTPSGILSKEEKGWVKAVTEESDGRKVQQRYLFCIEDPFELAHNVSRTVTHHGIVAIRDEFRRAKRILSSIGNGMSSREGALMDVLMEVEALNTAMESHDIDRPQQIHRQVPNNADLVVNRDPQRMAQLRFRSDTAQRARNSVLAESIRLPLKEPKALNVMDDAAFPSLGRGKSSIPGPTPTSKTDSPTCREKNKQTAYRGKTNVRQDHNSSEISGERAKELLAEIKRKNDEAATELVAKGTAEAVLGGDD